MNRSKQENTIERGNSGLALRAGFWYVASTFLLRSIAFITIPIFSRLLSKGDYGEFANYANWQSTLLIVTGAELYNSLSRAYYDYKDEYDKFVSSVTVLTFFLTSFVYVFFLTNRSWIYNIVKIPPQFVHIMFFTLLCSACKTLFLTRERTLYRYKSVVLISALDTVVPTLIAIALVAASRDSSRLAARIYGFWIPSSLIGLSCAFLMLLRGRSFDLKHCRFAITLSIPLLFNYLTISLLTSTNTIIAKNIGGSELSAEVSMATSVIHIVTILFQSLSGALTTWLMDNLEQKKMQKIFKDILVYLAGIVVVSIGVILLAPEVLTVLGGSQYASSVILIPGMVLAAFIQTVSSIFTIILTYDKNVVKTAVYACAAAVISVVAKVLLFPRFGVICLPAVNVVVCAVLFAINYYLVIEAGYKDAIDIRKFILACAVVMLFAAASSFLYSHAAVRYGIAAAGIVMVMIPLVQNRSKIIALLKQKH